MTTLTKTIQNCSAGFTVADTVRKVRKTTDTGKEVTKHLLTVRLQENQLRSYES